MDALVTSFAATLLAAVLISGLAHRTILSTAVLFLVAGFILGPGLLEVVDVAADDQLVSVLAELALFAVLFTDGMKVGMAELRTAWRLPGRALLLGMPLTFLITALLAHWVAGLGWAEAFLVGTILAPTDPVFAAAIVGREEVPGRLRRLLNVESGLNDGLALPVVLVLLAVAGEESADYGALAREVVLGVAVGVAVPYVAVRLERMPKLAASAAYEPLNAFAIGLLVLGICQTTHANLFLGAFTAGVTLATIGPRQKHAFEEFGELVAELFKLAALLVFGALISPAFLGDIPPSGYVFAVLALLVARPLALAVALAGSRITLAETASAAWFGPKGFASVVYGLLVLNSGLASGDELFHLVALVIILSIVAHSSTDVLIARYFARVTEPVGELADGGGDADAGRRASMDEPAATKPADPGD